MSSLFVSIEYCPGEHDDASDHEGEDKGSSLRVSLCMPGNQMMSSSAEGSSGNKFDVGDNILSIVNNTQKTNYNTF